MGVWKKCECENWDKCSHAWQLRTRRNGKLYRISADNFANRTIRTKTDAKALLGDFRTAVRQGKLRAEKDPTTFGELVELYRVHHVEARKLNYSSVGFQLNRLKERFKDLPLSEVVKPKHFDLFLAELKGKKPATRNRYRGLFRTVLNFAKRRELIEKTPFELGLFPFEKEKNQRSVRLSREEEVKLWREMNPWLRDLFIAALDTGLRRGALLSLQWKHVDLSNELLMVPGEIQKDGDPLVLPISGRLLKVLEKRQLDPYGEPWGDERFVFGDEFGNKRVTFRRAWESALRRAGIKGLHWHDLRGEMASRMLEAGVNVREIKDILGHSSVSVTERYLRPRVGSFQEAFRKLEAGQPSLSEDV